MNFYRMLGQTEYRGDDLVLASLGEVTEDFHFPGCQPCERRARIRLENNIQLERLRRVSNRVVTQGRCDEMHSAPQDYAKAREKHIEPDVERKDAAEDLRIEVAQFIRRAGCLRIR